MILKSALRIVEENCKSNRKESIISCKFLNNFNKIEDIGLFKMINITFKQNFESHPILANVLFFNTLNIIRCSNFNFQNQRVDGWIKGSLEIVEGDL